MSYFFIETKYELGDRYYSEFSPLFESLKELFDSKEFFKAITHRDFIFIHEIGVGFPDRNVMYLHSGDRFNVQLNPKDDLELLFIVELMSNYNYFGLFTLDVNNVLESTMYKKYEWMIMNRWFRDGKALYNFYCACRDFDKSIKTYDFLKAYIESHPGEVIC